MHRRRADTRRVLVDLGGLHRAECVVADTPLARQRGLNDYEGLAPHEGMLFPFTPPIAAAFHMDRVAFPIDILFVEPSGRIAKIVHEAQPGSKKIWRTFVASQVVELPGGTCGHRGIRAGLPVSVRGLDRGPAFWHVGQLQDNLPPGYNETHFPDPVSPDRFRGRELVDEYGVADTQPTPGFREGPIAPLDEYDAPVRQGALTFDPSQFVLAVLDSAAAEQGGPRWERDISNGGRTESAVVAESDITAWLRRAGAMAEATQQAREILQDPEVLRMVGEGFILAEMAFQASLQNVPGVGTVLLLTRGVG